MHSNTPPNPASCGCWVMIKMIKTPKIISIVILLSKKPHVRNAHILYVLVLLSLTIHVMWILDTATSITKTLDRSIVGPSCELLLHRL